MAKSDSVALKMLKASMTVKEAQFYYRCAWSQWLKATTAKDRKRAEREMDSVQGRCTSNGCPGKEWNDFVDTLPGFKDAWAKMLHDIINGET